MMKSSTHQGLFCLKFSPASLVRVRSVKRLAILALATAMLTHVDGAYGQTAATSPSAAASAASQLPPRVARFCRDVDSFSQSSNAVDTQARQFAVKLRDALWTNKPMPRVTPSDLSLEAAKKLANHFHEDIAAAIAHKEVIAPAAILKTFLQGVRGEELWRRIPLITNHALIPRALTDVPEVLVTAAQREKLAKALAEMASNVKKVDELKQVYKSAYRGHPGWFKAIAPYFVEQDNADE